MIRHGAGGRIRSRLFSPSLSAARARAAKALALSTLLMLFCAQPAIADTPDGVLILHSNQRATPAQVVIEDTLRTVVSGGLQRPVRIFPEYLDDELSAVGTFEEAEAALLREKYGQRNIRVIVADSLPALQFAIKFRDDILPGVPIVHIAVARDRLARLTLPRDVVGHTEDLDPTPTLQLALKLHPNTTRLVLIRGASDLDRLWDSRFRTAVQRVGDGFAAEYLSGLPTAEVLRRVRALSPGTVVFSPGYFVDGLGEVSTPRSAIERIASASPVPVYGTFDTFLGAGIVGGYMTRYVDEAKEGGAIVVKLLNGTPATEIPPAATVRTPMVDWRQLHRWNVDQRALPAGTIVMFQEPTLWETHRLEISVAIAVLLLQAVMITALLVERRTRLRTATELEESKDQLSLAAGAARLSLWAWDIARDRIWATAQPRRQVDSSVKPIAFDDMLRNVHAADREKLEQAAGKALATGGEFDAEYRVTGHDGETRWIAARGRAERGNYQRLLGVAFDVTERKNVELRAAEDRNALRHMTRVSMVGQLSAAIAHQLNQPLAAILGNAEAAQKMLEREKPDVAELRQICSDIVSENHRASATIRRLSELYKRGDMQLETIDLNELASETLDLLRTELLIRQVNPTTDLAPALPVVEGGRVQLQQVLLNLVMNAADAVSNVNAEERKLAIRTESSGTDVRLYVIDNGTGIVAKDMKKVFDPFWSTKAEGMGMGLAICHSIVAAHRGRVTVQNNEEGGASFCVTLPARLPT